MFSFQTAGNHFKYRLFFNLSNFNKGGNAIICSNKCSFPMQQFKKTATMQEQQFRMFRNSSLLQNSPNAASSMSPTLDVDEATTATNEELLPETTGEEIILEQRIEHNEMQADPTKPIQKESAIGSKLFARKIYPREAQKILAIKYEMGKSGQKFINIHKNFQTTSQIPVPADVFDFVQAMDEILEAVHANKKRIIEASPNRQERLYLHTAKAKGTNYDYQLELYVFNNIVYVQLRTLPNEHKPAHISKKVFLLLHQFHWLRHAIGQLFAANGEGKIQQQLGKPPSYPNWLNLDSHPYNLLPNNRRNFQLPQPQNNNVQRQQPQRVAPIQQKSAQPKMPSYWAAMSEQLLQLVFLQQQQLQQVQSAILKDQPMGGVGGAIAQKMGPDNTILMSELLAQAPTQPQSATMPRWNRNNNNVGYRKNWSDN